MYGSSLTWDAVKGTQIVWLSDCHHRGTVCHYLSPQKVFTTKAGQRELFDALYHQAVSTIEETITYLY